MPRLASWGAIIAACTLAACGSVTQSDSSTAASGGAQAPASTRGSSAATAATGSATSGTGTGSAGGSGSGAPAANAVVDPCTLVSLDEARTALGGDAHYVKHVAPGVDTTCTYSGEVGNPGLVSVMDFDKDHYPAATGAGSVKDQIRAEEEKRARTAGGTLQDLAGMGDSAFLVTIDKPASGGSPNAALYFIKGSVYVVLTVVSRSSPPTVASMSSLGKAAAGRL